MFLLYKQGQSHITTYFTEVYSRGKKETQGHDYMACYSLDTMY